MNTIKKNSIALTLGAVVVGSASMASTDVQANPFEFQQMVAGYQLDAGEGKCGEGKCGGDAKAKKEGKCGGDAKAKKEGKCGEGKCGGDAKAKKEGKCGEGKCGGSH
ncbi:hypothetical protein FHG08_13030 [Pseudoalteromonas sp. Scap03]|nr:hypothetical protein [Pseudoalteromonas sp. Scap03]